MYITVGPIILGSVPQQPPAVDGGPNSFLPWIFRKHRLLWYEQSDKTDWHPMYNTAYREHLGKNLITNPTSFVCLGEEFHVAMGEVGSVMSIEYKNQWRRRGSYYMGQRESHLTGREQGIMLSVRKDPEDAVIDRRLVLT